MFRKESALFVRLVCGLLGFVLLTSLLVGVGAPKASAAVSPLITPYKPQVQNVAVNVSYVNSAGQTVSGVINHPGVAMNKLGLDNMRDHARAGDEPWSSAFAAYANESRSSKTPRIYYEENNEIFIDVRGPWAYTNSAGVYYGNPSEYVGDRANKDGATAVKQAIMWYITGDEAYRANAMYIIRAYSNIQSVATHTNFRFATLTYLLAFAAEILRYSDTPTAALKWTAADTTKLSNMMDKLTVTYNPHTFFMNQHQFSVMGAMGRAIFTNNYQLYAEAVEATTVNAAGGAGGRNGSIKEQMRWMTKNERTGAQLPTSDHHVQLIEMGRDVGHSYLNIPGLSTLAQTIYAQGTKVDPVSGAMSAASNAVNPFQFLNDRLLEGATYLLKYHYGYDVLWTPASAEGSAVYYDAINSFDRGRIDTGFGILYNYYRYIENRDMTQEKYKYLAYVYETRLPEGASDDFPASSTLLFTPDAAKNVGLGNAKPYQNDSDFIKQAEYYSSVLAGSPSIVTEGTTRFVRANANGAGAQFAFSHYYIPNKATLGLRVRSNGPATIQIVQKNRSNAPLATYTVPHTGNGWYTLGYNISNAALLDGKVLYVVINGSATQVDIDYLDFNPAPSSITPLSALPVVSLQSHNYAAQYLRHVGFRARIDANVSPEQDRQFKLVAGLANGAGVSFESLNFPGQYLRVRANGEVWLETNDNSTAFKNDATFRQVAGLAAANKASFQMWNDSSRYLRHVNYLMYAQSGSGATFNNDATFAVVNQ
jgi:hypothetical protein